MIDPWTILGGIGVFIAGIVAAFWRGRKSAETGQKAKERDAYEEQLRETAAAHDARNRVDPDRVPANDKYRRD